MKPFFFVLGWVLLALIIAVAWDARRRAKLHAAFDRLARELGLTWDDGRLIGTLDGIPIQIEAAPKLRRDVWLSVKTTADAWSGPEEAAADAARSLARRRR